MLVNSTGSGGAFTPPHTSATTTNNVSLLDEFERVFGNKDLELSKHLMIFNKALSQRDILSAISAFFEIIQHVGTKYHNQAMPKIHINRQVANSEVAPSPEKISFILNDCRFEYNVEPFSREAQNICNTIETIREEKKSYPILNKATTYSDIFGAFNLSELHKDQQYNFVLHFNHLQKLLRENRQGANNTCIMHRIAELCKINPEIKIITQSTGYNTTLILSYNSWGQKVVVTNQQAQILPLIKSLHTDTYRDTHIDDIIELCKINPKFRVKVSELVNENTAVTLFFDCWKQKFTTTTQQSQMLLQSLLTALPFNSITSINYIIQLYNIDKSLKVIISRSDSKDMIVTLSCECWEHKITISNGQAQDLKLNLEKNNIPVLEDLDPQNTDDFEQQTTDDSRSQSSDDSFEPNGIFRMLSTTIVDLSTA